MYFDSHAHYNDVRFETECEGGADGLLDRLLSSGVSHIVNASWDIASSLSSMRLAEKYPGRIYAAVGIHPSDSRACTDINADRAKIADLLDEREKNGIVAIGETGFDYHYPDTDKKRQYEYFEMQMKLAACYDVPVVIHDRDAHGDCMEMIRRFPVVRGVMHSFSGSAQTARELVSLGWYVSFSGVLTFKNARVSREAAAAVAQADSTKLMIETDCPYLAPEPHRGELNHSGNLAYTAAALGQIMGISAQDAAALTERNAARFYSVKL